MTYLLAEETFASLNSIWTGQKHNLNWSSIFVLPDWLRVWWQSFGGEAGLYLRSVRQGDKIIGIAPLMVQNESATFVGSVAVSDYLDFVVTPGLERQFCSALLNDLAQKNINGLDLKPVRPDSIVVTHLADIARERKCEVDCKSLDVSYEMELPATYDEYLMALPVKQRHELKRKLRRLHEAGSVSYRTIEDSKDVHGIMNTFLKLFAESREDKATFMTTRMESFFRSVVDAMAGIGLLRFGILELNMLPVAMVLCFDYNNRVYLYNSGYNPDYKDLSVGLLSKVLCIKDSIERGRKTFDFLKGGETYKHHVGGRGLPLYSCYIKLR